MPATYDPIASLTDAAAEYGMHVVFGTIEPINAANATAYNLIVMAYPDGRTPARYRRTHPNGPWNYTGGKFWEFQYVAGDEFPVFDTAYGKVGLAMCSEVYMPEVTRALALRGAELIFMPAGVNKKCLWATWRSLIWARAIENLAVVVTTQNMFTSQERGLALIAGPEEILFESTAPGMSVIELGLDRVRQLRASRDEVGSSAEDATKAGLLDPSGSAPNSTTRYIRRPGARPPSSRVRWLRGGSAL
jgi:predicted amidohydrolase